MEGDGSSTRDLCVSYGTICYNTGTIPYGMMVDVEPHDVSLHRLLTYQEKYGNIPPLTQYTFRQTISYTQDLLKFWYNAVLYLLYPNSVFYYAISRWYNNCTPLLDNSSALFSRNTIGFLTSKSFIWGKRQSGKKKCMRMKIKFNQTVLCSWN